MKAEIEIEMNNAAFKESSAELAYILHALASQIERGCMGCFLRDHSDNLVGRFTIDRQANGAEGGAS